MRIIEMAEERNLTLRLFGGLAFYLRCPSAGHRSLQREYVDIDFMAHASQKRDIDKLFIELGYVPRERFNAMQGYRRMIFEDITNQRRVDIFLDLFQMCHNFNLKDRLEIDRHTISLADLLATKLQIVEINDKDIKDVLAMLVDHDIGDKDLPDVINGRYLAELCSNDWGVCKTFTINLDRIARDSAEKGLAENQKTLVQERILRLKKLIHSTPKSLRWKLRSKIGDRVPWYVLPEADHELLSPNERGF
jgi:hypothetical protein